jgi:hypothetical protein
MSEEITASFTFDSATVMPGVRWSSQRTLLGQLRFPIYTCILLLGSLGTYLGERYRIPGMLFIAGALIGIFGWQYILWRCRRSIKSSPSYNKLVSYRFSESGVEQETPNSKSQASWDAFIQSYLTPDGLLLYPQKGIFFWLPESAFRSKSDYERLTNLVAQKTKFAPLGWPFMDSVASKQISNLKSKI